MMTYGFHLAPYVRHPMYTGYLRAQEIDGNGFDIDNRDSVLMGTYIHRVHILLLMVLILPKFVFLFIFFDIKLHAKGRRYTK